MKLTAILLVLVVVVLTSIATAYPGIRSKIYGSVLPPSDSHDCLTVTDDPEEKWFSNYIDHFNPQDNRRFKQRYFENTQFVDWEEEADTNKTPVFVFLGGEGTLSSKWVTQGTMFELAKTRKAVLLALEHRYYGKSQPFDYDLSIDKIAYLSSEQAIEDVMTFVRDYVTHTLRWSRERPIITFGGSYAGQLSALVRARHPHLIRGAVSASAPFEPEIDFSVFLEVSTEALRIYGGDECVNNVKSAVDQIHALSWKDLTSKVNGCKSIENPTEMDIQNFWFLFSDLMGEIPQYNKEGGPGVTVQKVCEALAAGKEKNAETGVLDAYLDIFHQVQGEKCFEMTYDEMMTTLTKPEPTSMMRQWIYQTCTEFGYYQTTMSDKQVFGPVGVLNLDYFVNVCKDAYSPNFDLNYIKKVTDRTRDAYGGWYFQATNVALTNGNIDPWYTLSFTEQCKNRDPSAVVIFMERTSHCAILYAAQTYDVQTLIDGRATLAGLIDQWIAAKY